MVFSQRCKYVNFMVETYLCEIGLPGSGLQLNYLYFSPEIMTHITYLLLKRYTVLILLNFEFELRCHIKCYTFPKAFFPNKINW